MDSTQQMTLSDFTGMGYRFRLTDDQKARVDAGEITREQAFEEFRDNGGVDRRINAGKTPTRRYPAIPASFWLDPELTLDNYAEKIAEATGIPRRFRVPRNLQGQDLTREEAFARVVQQHRETQQETQVNEPSI
jgi:hypothetical protein